MASPASKRSVGDPGWDIPLLRREAYHGWRAAVRGARVGGGADDGGASGQGRYRPGFRTYPANWTARRYSPARATKAWGHAPPTAGRAPPVSGAQRRSSLDRKKV